MKQGGYKFSVLINQIVHSDPFSKTGRSVGVSNGDATISTDNASGFGNGYCASLVLKRCCQRWLSELPAAATVPGPRRLAWLYVPNGIRYAELDSGHRRRGF